MRILIFCLTLQAFAKYLKFYSESFDSSSKIFSYTVRTYNDINVFFPDDIVVYFRASSSNSIETPNWKQNLTNGELSGTIYYGFTTSFSIVADALNYESAISNSYTLNQNPYCWHISLSISKSAACVNEVVTLTSELRNLGNHDYLEGNKNFHVEDLSGSMISTIDKVSVTGAETSLISFNSIGLKTIYVVYYESNINTIQIYISDGSVRLIIPKKPKLIGKLFDVSAYFGQCSNNYWNAYYGQVRMYYYYKSYLTEIMITNSNSAGYINLPGIAYFASSGEYTVYANYYYENSCGCYLSTTICEYIYIQYEVRLITPASQNSLSLFSITAGIYENGILLQSLNSYQISLFLGQSNAVLYGTLTGNIASGAATFSNVSIDNSGDFTIVGNSIVASDGKTDIIKNTKVYLYVKLANDYDKVSTDNSLNFKIYVYCNKTDETICISCDTIVYLEIYTIDSSYANYTSKLSFGFAVFNDIFITKENNYTIKARGGNSYSENSLSLEVKNYYPNFSFSYEPINTTNIFDIYITIYIDQDFKSIIEENMEFTIGLSLSSSGIIIGLTSITTLNGLANFTDLKISTIGDFNLTISGILLKNISYSLCIDDRYILPEIQSKSPMYIVDDFAVTVTIFIDKAYTTKNLRHNNNITLLLISEDLNQTHSLITADGEAIFDELRLTSPGNYSILVLCFERFFVKISGFIILNSYFGAHLDSGVISSVLDSTIEKIFTVYIGIYTDSMLQFIYNINDCVFLLESTTTDFIFSKSISTIDGLAAFSNINIVNEGLYNLTATTLVVLRIDFSISIKNYYVSINFIPEAPITTDSIFDIEVLVYFDAQIQFPCTNITFDEVLFLYDDINDNEICSVSISDGAGVCQNQNVAKEGTFYIKVFGAKTMNYVSVAVLIKNTYINIAIHEPIPVNTENIFSLSVRIYSDLDFSILSNTASFTIELTLYPSSDYIWSNKITTINGEALLSQLRIIKEGIYMIKASEKHIISNYSLTFEIKNCYLYIEFVGKIPSFSQHIFTVKIIAYHDFTTKEICTEKSYYVNISIEPEGNLIGTQTGTMSRGALKLNNLRINSLGPYILKAYNEKALPGDFPLIVIKDFYLQVTFFTIPYTTESKFSIIVTAFSDKNFTIPTYDFNSLVILSFTPSGFNTNVSYINSTSSKAIFQSLSIFKENIYTITAISPDAFKGTTESFEIKNYYLNISFVSKIGKIAQPVNTESVFTLNVSIFYSAELEVICNECLFTIDISLSNNKGKLSGTKSVSAINGTAIFTKLQILTENNFTIKAKGKQVIALETYPFIIKNYYLTVNLLQTEFPIHNKNTFDVSVKVYEDVNLTTIYKGNSYSISLILIPDSEIDGSLHASTSKGKANFYNIKVLQNGTYSFEASGFGVIAGESEPFYVDYYAFSWTVTINKSNEILIAFDKNVSYPFKRSDILFDPVKNYGMKFVLQELSRPLLNITTNPLETIPQDTEVKVKILKTNIKSDDGYYFDYSEKTILLNYVFVPFPTLAATAAVTNTSKSSTTAIGSSSVVAGIVSNPSFLWSLMNSLDVLAYMPIGNLRYTANTAKFFTTMGSLNVMPNPAEYMFTVSNESTPYSLAKNYGLSTSYVLYNSGLLVFNFIFCVSLIPILFLCTKIFKNKIGTKCSKLLKSYKYKYFLRFWLQGYLNFGFLAIVQLKSNYPNSLAGMINVGVACIIAVLFILTPPLLFVCGFVTYQSRGLRDSQEFNQKWGCLFMEFKNDKGYFSTQFYSVFTLRRLIFVLSQLFLTENLYIQNTVNIFSLLIQMIFTLFYMPYKDTFIFISTIIGELCTLVVMILMYFFIFDTKLSTRITIEAAIIFIVMSTLAIEFLLSFYLLGCSIKEAWKRIEEARALRFVSAATQITTMKGEIILSNPGELTSPKQEQRIFQLVKSHQN